MLYISHSIGGGGGGAVGNGGFTRPTFGLRVEQVRQGGNLGDPEGGDAFSHRELINWQLQAHSNFHIADMRVQLGHRVTYDVTNQSFGSQGGRSAMQIGIPTLRNGSATPVEVKPALGRASASPIAPRDSSNLREIASAAISALTPARFTSAERQFTQHPGIANQRIPTTRPVNGGVN